jgi:hypothetical protein
MLPIEQPGRGGQQILFLHFSRYFRRSFLSGILTYL